MRVWLFRFFILFGVGAFIAFGQNLESILAQTGLDEDLVAVLPVESPRGRVLFVFVYLSPRIFQSRIGPTLAEKLRPHVGTHSLLVWVYTMASVSFDPRALAFAQGEKRVSLSPEQVVPLEGDFLAGHLMPGIPVAAVIRLGNTLDPTQKLVIHYGNIASTTLAVRGK
ncbi:MAG: hypothetical protein NZ651_06420 [Candidatus Bipolaricaulota bacterium]|nr:hypothetical protein [Candidatus Bipolaricaulota bacterium]MDW8127389.1 hypothetical protein [Candidatus Bipolaricaulota bacterium]